MRVLLLGSTGNVGSRLLPSLVAHGHSVIIFVRNPSKLTEDAKNCATAIVTGSATDDAAIKAALMSRDCGAVINAAGLAPVLGQSGELPAIFAAVVKAALEASDLRGGAPIRCWLLSGFGILESPREGYVMLDYIPIYTVHKQNYALIQSIPSKQLSWSLFCANNMPPRSQAVNYSPEPGHDAENLIANIDRPPAWSNKLQWVPLIGTYLNIMSQAQDYFTPLEDCIDFIARDLSTGLESLYVGHRVSVKVKPKNT